MRDVWRVGSPSAGGVASTYIPRNCGLTAPEGEEVYEFLVRVQSRPGILGRLSRLFGEYNFDVLVGSLQVSENVGVNTFYVEAAEATISVEEMVERLRAERYVLEARATQTAEVFFEHYYFPLTSGGRFRIFAMSADALLALEKELFKRFGTAASSILYNVALATGREIIDKIRERDWGDVTPTPDLLLANFAAGFRAYGQGVLKVFEEPSLFRVEVEEPLMAEGEGEVLDHLSIGIVVGALEAIYEREFRVEDPRYDKAERKLRFRVVEK